MRFLLLLLAFATACIAPGADAQTPPPKTARAIFAGGCFWCMEGPFDAIDGVISTTSGYSGGEKANPTYHDVSSGKTGHYEVVQVEYDPAKVPISGCSTSSGTISTRSTQKASSATRATSIVPSFSTRPRMKSGWPNSRRRIFKPEKTSRSPSSRRCCRPRPSTRQRTTIRIIT